VTPSSTPHISSPHRLATRAGERVIAAGGSAVDGAIATAAVLTVVYPHMVSLGGDAWALVSPTAGEVVAVNGSGSYAHEADPVSLDDRVGQIGRRCRADFYAGPARPLHDSFFPHRTAYPHFAKVGNRMKPLHFRIGGLPLERLIELPGIISGDRTRRGGTVPTFLVPSSSRSASPAMAAEPSRVNK